MGQALFAEYESVLARSDPFLRSPISERERDALIGRAHQSLHLGARVLPVAAESAR